MGTPVGKDEFLSNKTSEKLLNHAKLSTDGSKSTMPAKMAVFNKASGKMFKGSEMNPTQARAK